MLGIWLLLIVYGKSHIEVEIVLLGATLDGLEMSNQGHSAVKSPVPHYHAFSVYGYY